MSSSSRSIAAARARRAGEPAPPVSGTRPGTSINSHAAFAPQMQQPYQQQPYQQQPYQQQPPSNVRVPRGQPPMPPQMQQQMQQQMSQQMQQNPANGLPFSKLSISDAIGLITLRLGRVEQFIIDVENGETSLNVSPHELSIPENSKVIDTSVLTNIVTRLDSLEKKETGTGNSEQVTKINEEIASIGLQVRNLNEEINKANLLKAQNSEKVFKLDRDLIEIKDLLISLVLKLDLHIQETNEKFCDYEYAIGEIEKNIPQTPVSETVLNSENMGFSLQEQEQDNSAILSVDLKNIIKQELANV